MRLSPDISQGTPSDIRWFYLGSVSASDVEDGDKQYMAGRPWLTEENYMEYITDVIVSICKELKLKHFMRPDISQANYILSGIQLILRTRPPPMSFTLMMHAL